MSKIAIQIYKVHSTMFFISYFLLFFLFLCITKVESRLYVCSISYLHPHLNGVSITDQKFSISIGWT